MNFTDTMASVELVLAANQYHCSSVKRGLVKHR